MKRYIVMLIVVLFFSYTICADAKEGHIELTLPPEAEVCFSYVQIADLQNGEWILKDRYRESGVNLNQLETGKEIQEAITKLQQYKPAKQQLVTAEDGRAIISDLEEGVYLVESVSTESYQVSSMLVAVPFYDEQTGEMTYDISVEPKWEVISESVKTGDESNVRFFLAICIISLIICAVLSCHMYFKCGRMTDKYSRKWRI